MPEVGAIFDRAQAIDDFQSISGKDLDVKKDGDKVIMSYRRRDRGNSPLRTSLPGLEVPRPIELDETHLQACRVGGIDRVVTVKWPCRAPGAPSAMHLRTRDYCSEALTHRSFSADRNEQLEFLGDSVAQSGCIAPALHAPARKCLKAICPGSRPIWSSGTARCISSQSSLTLSAPLLRLGEGEARSGGPDKPSILAERARSRHRCCLS